ncbi:MAG: hypothetical protein QXX95_00600 [Nitrososphaerales archaeon]
MKEEKIYARLVKAGGRNYVIYASKSSLERFGKEVHQEKGYRFYVEEQKNEIKIKSIDNIVLLPDEQSWSTFFPFEFFLLGNKRKIAHVMDSITQKLRAGNSLVNCFYKGCRNPASFYAETPEGCWYACSEAHMSNYLIKEGFITKENLRQIKINL